MDQAILLLLIIIMGFIGISLVTHVLNRNAE
jgi:hypothetical protein